MTEDELLTAALPQAWNSQLFIANKALTWLGGTFGQVEAYGSRRRLTLLGGALDLVWKLTDGNWGVHAEGPLLGATNDLLGQLPAPEIKNGVVAFTLPPQLFSFDGRMSIEAVADVGLRLELAPGVARLVLHAKADGKAVITFDPLGGGAKTRGLPVSHALPLQAQSRRGMVMLTLKVAADQTPILLEHEVGGQVRFAFEALKALGDSAARLEVDINATLQAGVKELLSGLQLGKGENTLAAGILSWGQGKASLVERVIDGAPQVCLQLEGFAAKFGERLLFTAKPVFLDGGLRLRNENEIKDELSSIQLRLVKPAAFFADDAAPFTCVIHEGAEFDLKLGAGTWALASRATPSAIATVIVPGVSEAVVSSGVDEAKPEIRKRFVLDVISAEAAALEIDDSGASIRAVARKRPIEISVLRGALVTGGDISIRRGDWQLHLFGEALLPWFEGALGRLSVTGGRSDNGYSFGAAFDVQVSEEWTDPSGVLTFRTPRVGATLAWSDANWVLGGYVSGALVFNAAPLIGDASSWVKELFTGLSCEIDRLDLAKLGKLNVEGGTLRLGLKLPLRVSLWSIFQLEIAGITIRKELGIGLDGAVSFSLGPVRFGGTLPELGIAFASGRVSLDSRMPPSFKGELSAPSGIRVQMAFKRTRDAARDVLSGFGNMTAPTIPDAAVMVKVGRIKGTASDQWLPTIAINANAPVNVPVFPGIVLKRVGVGFGVHQSLRGMNDVKTAEQAYRLLQSGDLPQPGNPESWIEDAATDFTFVAQTMLAATTAPHDSPDYYVADLVLALDSQLRLGAFTRMWLFTSPNDTLTAAFQDRPYSRGVLIIDATEPSIVAAHESLKDPKTSIEAALGPAGPILGAALGLVRTRASFEARPGLLNLTLGPNDISFSVGPFRANGRTLLGIHASGAGVYALASFELSAGFAAGFSLNMGLIAVGVEASAGFAAHAVLFGGILRGQLLLAADIGASAHASLALWIEIRFFIRIRLGIIRVTLSFTSRWTFSFSLQLSIGATLGLSTQHGIGFRGTAAVELRVLGIAVGGQLNIAANTALLEEARQAMKQAKQGHLAPSGAS